MSYTVGVLPSAERDLQKLPSRDWKRIRDKIDSLAANPRPHGAQKLHGTNHGYRVRTGVYRILYRIDDDRRLVTVYVVGRRKDVYR